MYYGDADDEFEKTALTRRLREHPACKYLVQDRLVAAITSSGIPPGAITVLFITKCRTAHDRRRIPGMAKARR